MNGVRVYTGNRMETLVDRLARVVGDPPPSCPLTPEVIVVQSRGMARWLSMELARRFGVWAGCAYPFPNAFLEGLFRLLIEDLPETSPFEPEALAFRVMGLLPDCLGLPAYRMPGRYLEGDAGGLKAWQLARRIADTFDQYLVFRPRMVLGWEAGQEGRDPDEAWQADLWRRVVAGCGGLHRARLMGRLAQTLESRLRPLPQLPERVSVFGISYLPPFYLHALEALSRRVPVHIFLMSPCREYWGDILSPREIRGVRSARAAGDGENGGGDLPLESGHPLLASMGGMGRDFFRLICGLEADMRDFSEAPAPGSLLASLQGDILDLRDRSAAPQAGPPGTGLPEPGPRAPGDDSFQVHACHSPLREIEVLHDHLLAMFDADPALAPRDIAVMTPDIEAYAPYIQAVFGAQAEGGPRVPFSLADRSVRRVSGAVEAFLSLLDFKESRLGAAEVMTLLEAPAVQARFGMEDRDLETALRWVRDTRIRWGADERSRQELGLPRYGDNSWKAGIDRLLLGWAMPGEGRAMFAGILPYDDVEGGDWEALEKFLGFLDALFEASRSLGGKRTLSGWQVFLTGLLESFFVSDASGEPALQVIRQALDDLGGYQGRAGFDAAVELEPVRAYLDERLARDPPGQGFLAGGVTFCALLPMRSIPFKVICLIGMNGDSFPRETRTVGFDLMARHPAPGDRSRRADDKYLFLEALVSARQRFYVSYVGRSIQDDSVIPPCVLVSELLDHLGEAYGLDPRDLVTEHRLQAFSPAYFSGRGRLFSYSEENLEAAAGLARPAGNACAAFISRGLADPGDEWRRLDVEGLARFFRNPSRFLLRRRLGLGLESGLLVPEERESFALEGLERFLMAAEVVEAGLSGADTRECLALHRAAGRLPPGAVGEAAFEALREEAAELVGRVRDLAAPERFETREVALEIAGFFIGGRLEGVTAAGVVHVHAGKATGARQLDTWIRHLVLGAAGGAGRPPRGSAYLVCRDRTWAFGFPADPQGVLAALLARYWQGLVRPLAFFPESSMAYAEQALGRGKTRDAAMKSARARWGPGTWSGARCEGEDPYVDLCFGKGCDPLGGDFVELAEEIYGPLLACRREA